MNIYTQLFEAKKEIGTISKDSRNPFFKSKYFDINKVLEVIEPILQKHEILLLQPLKDGIVTTILITKDGKSSVESSMQLPPINDPQKLGSAITYFRRYTLQSLLGLQAEDDDANLAAKPVVKKQPVTPQQIPQANPTVILKALTPEQFEKIVNSKNKKHAEIALNKYSANKAQLIVLKAMKDGN